MKPYLARYLRLVAKIFLSAALISGFLFALAQLMLIRLSGPKAFPGYTLVAPILSTNTYLVDMQGRTVRTWESQYIAGQVARLLENGHLLRAAQLPAAERLFGGPQAGGRIQEFTWEGELVWDFKFHNAKQIPHHDIARLPDGNVLLIVWELKTSEETIDAGRSPESVDGPWLVDSIVEIKPSGRTRGEIVWEWHVWDHLIQDQDSARRNHGDVRAHPERIDVNFGETLLSEVTHAGKSPEAEAKRKAQFKTLTSIGYLGSPGPQGAKAVMADWTHVNALSYNAKLDQIMLTSRAFSELWIIDHSTTSAEARGHTGGRSGMGGDLLYRWGNPQAYRAGTKADQRLFSPHDAHWIPAGVPGAGHILVFNNGLGRPGGDYSSVDEIILPVEAGGRYIRNGGVVYGPSKPIWSYTAPDPVDFAVGLLSSAQRLPNGNTLICDGVKGKVFEVAPDRTIVWQQLLRGIIPSEQHQPSQLSHWVEPSPKRHEIVPVILRGTLKTSPAQNQMLDDLQNAVDNELDRMLTDEQKQQLQEMSASKSGGWGGFTAPGQIISLSREMMLKPTDRQRKTLAELQKHVDEELDKVLTVAQKARFERVKQDFVRSGLPINGHRTLSGAVPISSRATHSEPGASILPEGVNPIFRALRYGADYEGLAGKGLRSAG